MYITFRLLLSFALDWLWQTLKMGFGHNDLPITTPEHGTQMAMDHGTLTTDLPITTTDHATLTTIKPICHQSKWYFLRNNIFMYLINPASIILISIYKDKL